jgi:outer membrane translocation and assembly module TamA
MPCAAQTQSKPSAACAPTRPATGKTREASESEPRQNIIIDDVIFAGPTPPDPQTAQRAIDEIKHHDSSRVPEWLDEILEISIRGAWQEDGYFKVMATGESQIVSDDTKTQHVVLTIHVDAGRPYWLGNVAFRSSDPDEPLAFSVGELRPLLSLQEGDVFNVVKIRESLDAMKRRYGENGYIDFVATPVTEVDDTTQRISLIFEFDQTKQFRIDALEMHGLDPSREAALTSKLHSARQIQIARRSTLPPRFEHKGFSRQHQRNASGNTAILIEHAR